MKAELSSLRTRCSLKGRKHKGDCTNRAVTGSNEILPPRVVPHIELQHITFCGAAPYNTSQTIQTCAFHGRKGLCPLHNEGGRLKAKTLLQRNPALQPLTPTRRMQRVRGTVTPTGVFKKT